MNTKSKIDKNHLISIVEDIILEDGLSGLSIRKVATKANISIGGVQYIFGNKEGMLRAVANKNGEEYNKQIEHLVKNDSSQSSIIKAHIEYALKYTGTKESNKISKMIGILLQDEIILQEFREWFNNSLNSIDLSSDEGKKLRLAFLLTEGLFSLLSLKYLDLNDKEKKEILEDLKTFLL